MIASIVKGILLEKLVKQYSDNETGELKPRYYLRIMQKGSKNGSDIEVTKELFDKQQEGKEVELKDISITVWKEYMVTKSLELNDR